MPHATRRTRISRPRRGSLTVEMLLVVVVLAIVTVGIVQFGVFFANAEEVALAARVGALEASQTAGLPAVDGAPVPGNIVSAIEHQLDSSCIAWCRVRVEHNVEPSDDAVVLSSPPDGCDCGPAANLPEPPGEALTAVTTRYVRVTVCVPLSEVFPKQLSFFGAQLYGPDKTYEHTVTMRYELTAP